MQEKDDLDEEIDKTAIIMVNSVAVSWYTIGLCNLPINSFGSFLMFLPIITCIITHSFNLLHRMYYIDDEIEIRRMIKEHLKKEAEENGKK